ncbi:MAG: branched-chain amino acid transport system ATP-binding protein [Glaciecola sp.]|jgi:branched-chain amino acid transport system ATP-binding protein
MPALALVDIQVRFGGIVAVDGLSLEVNAGEIVGLIGPNGAGKTVSFNVITGLQKPDHGRVLLDGLDVTRLAPHKRTEMGLGRTFQLVQLFGGMTVRENCMVAAHRFTHDGVVGGALRLPQRGRALREARARADAALDFLGLGDLADTAVDGLPIGQARLVELARALCLQPKILLLDEPASGLDPTETADLAVTLARIRATIGCAMLLVEHDMSVVNGLCDHVYAMAFGRLIANGSPEDVRRHPEVLRSYLGDDAVAQEPVAQGAAHG